MNAKNKISRSVLKVNCTYTIEDTVRFASLPFISTLLHQALPDPSSNRQAKEASHPPKKYPPIQKKHTYKLLLLAYLTLPYLPTHLPISNEQEQKHDPIALLFSFLLFPSPSPPRPQPKLSQSNPNPPKTYYASSSRSPQSPHLLRCLRHTLHAETPHCETIWKCREKFWFDGVFYG